jgi:hypothetical protein
MRSHEDKGVKQQMIEVFFVIKKKEITYSYISMFSKFIIMSFEDYHSIMIE